MTNTFEIYFYDLNQEAQDELLEEFQTTESEENWHTIPIAVIDREIEDN